MDEPECNPNSETSNLNVNKSDEKTEVKSTDKSCKTEQVSTKSETIVKSVETTIEKSSEIIEKEMMDDDDGEDLPDNFFDDFSNNDFMAGLNIVDDWMDDEEDSEKRRRDDYFQDDVELRAKSSERRPDGRRERRESSPRHRPRYGDRDHYTKRDRLSREDERFRRHRSFDRRSRDRDVDRRRSRDRDFERRRSRSHDRFRDERRSRERIRSRDRDRSRPREHDRPPSEIRNSKNDSKDRPLDDNIDSRRDPEKTKRDIQRDKLRCAKDFEARVFQEQLKVAETGLVPPGTELDVVMEHEKRKLEEQHAVVEKPPEHKKEEVLPPARPVEKKRSADRFRGRDKTHSKSRGRHSRDRHSRERRSRDRRSRERDLRDRRDLRSRDRELRSRDRELRDRRSRDRDLRSRDRDLRERRFSPEFRSRKREYERFNRSRDRSVSPRFQRRSRSVDREEMYRQNDDLRLRIREKRRERYFNELSPVSEAKFSRSPSLTNLSLISNISEREFWLRNRDKYKSRYGRSCSPISSSSLSDLGSPRRKRSRKASFMEEIERKLRARAKTRNTTNFGSPLVSNPEQPQPVPPPQQFQQQMHVNVPFQSQNPQMFQQGMVQNPYPQPQVVDHGMMMHHQHQPMPLMSLMTAPPTMGPMGGPEMLGLPPTVIEQPMIQMHHQHQVVNPMAMQVQQQPTANSPMKPDSSSHRISSNLKPCVSDANKEVTKLFEEQKISLSDYLSVSAKPIDPKSPVINVHRKIKVISKCQDVIRVLKDDSKFCGRFFPRPAPAGLEKQEEKSNKWKSPLRKTFPVRFMFTTPCKKPPVQTDFVKNIINKLLFVCGIPALPGSELPILNSAGSKIENASTSSNTLPNILSSSQVNFTPKPIPAPISFAVTPQKPKNTPLPQQSVLIKRTTIGLQTDPVKCQICEIRSARKFSDQGCQTNEKDMVDESTQVTNEDLQKSIVTFTPRGILKNSSSSLQSLSHLTPAQLLSLQQEKSDDGWNIASRNESFTSSRNTHDQFSNTSGGSFMGRSTGNTPMNTNFNIGSGMNNPNMNRLSTNMSGNNFNSSFSGSMDKHPFSNMQNRPFSNQHGNQPSMNPGNSMNDFQNMASRNADNRSGNFDRFPNDRYSPEQSFNDSNNMNFNNRNMGGNMNSNRGRGGTTNRGFFMNYGGQNRPFYNN